MRNQMAMAPQILAQGQQRLQGVPAQFEPRFMERFVSNRAAASGVCSSGHMSAFSLRELVPPAEMVAPDGRQMHMGPHLGPPLPPHAAVLPGRAFPGAGERVSRRWDLNQSWGRETQEILNVHCREFVCKVDGWCLNTSSLSSQLDTASCRQSPWKQLPGDRSSFTSKI